MQNMKPIGVFDSGIGGLSVLKHFIRYLPYENYIYLGDTARVPYGNKSADTVIRYSKEAASFLINKGVKLIVIACNSASSVALEAVREMSPVPVIGMIEPASASALRETKSGVIGIIGTRATIASNAYPNMIKTLTNTEDIKIFMQACPLFVPIVEEGWLEHSATRLIAEEYLSEFRTNNIDTLILGCTHYPLLKPLLQELLPRVALIDSGEHAAVNAIRILAEQGNLTQEQAKFIRKPKITFYVTDMPATFYQIAELFLGFTIQKVEKISLEQN